MQTYLTPECDNVYTVHDMVDGPPVKGGQKAYCRNCNRTYYLKHNKNGACDNKEYLKLFYAFVVQPNKPLYYKVHPGHMKLL